MKVRVQEGATAGEEGLARGEEPHSLADVYPPNSMAAPPPPGTVQSGGDRRDVVLLQPQPTKPLGGWGYSASQVLLVLALQRGTDPQR